MHAKNFPARPETMNPEQRAVTTRSFPARAGASRGRFGGAHNPELADKWQAIGALLRYGTALTPRLSEIAILVTGRACNSPFEWYAHRAEAEKAGIEQAIIEALLAQTEPPGLSADERPSGATRSN